MEIKQEFYPGQEVIFNDRPSRLRKEFVPFCGAVVTVVKDTGAHVICDFGDDLPLDIRHNVNCNREQLTPFIQELGEEDEVELLEFLSEFYQV